METTTYIINPWMIYLIEQLRSIDGLLFLISTISLITTAIFLYKVLNELSRDEHNNSYSGYSPSCSITDRLDNINAVCIDIKNCQERISKVLSEINSKETLTDHEKENISLGLGSLLSRTDDRFRELNQLSDTVNHNMGHFMNYKKALKISLAVLVSSLILNTFLPSKDAAYKILISSYVTQENITTMGNITTDIANGIVDKLTESIIKIQEAGK
jgi:hypothetical protein